MEPSAVPGAAVPAVPPEACAAAEATSARGKLKRTGSGAHEATELKRPRTAPPATPTADQTSNGGELSGSDDEVARAPAGPAEAGAPRPPASAPAALNRVRPAASAPAAPSSGGGGSAGGSGSSSPRARNTPGLPGRPGAATGSLAVTQHQPHPPHSHGTHPHPNSTQGDHAPSPSVDASAAGPGPSLAAAAAAAAAAGPSTSAPRSVSPARSDPGQGSSPGMALGGGPGPAFGRGSFRHHAPHSDPHHDPHTHRHDPLEEQVFSPSFHLPTPPSAGHTPAGGSPGAGAGAASAADGSPAAALVAAVAGAGPAVALRASHPPGPACTRIHAIDLNVVEGVALESEEGEEVQQEAGSGAAEGGARAEAAWQGRTRAGSRRAQAAEAGAGPAEQGAGAETPAAAVAAAAATSSGLSTGGIAAVGEELSSEGEGEEENDENAPAAGWTAWASAAAAPVAAAGPVTRQRATGQPPRPPPGYTDAVLVASAPRALAAAVSAALPGRGAAAADGAAVPPPGHLAPPLTPAGEEEASESEEEEEDFLEFDPLVFIKQLPPLEEVVPPHRPALLPLQTRALAGRKTLVLDLDETLVHSSLEAVDRPDFSFPVTFNGADHTVYVRQRPHLRDFMVRVASLFEVVVFTASQRIYAERLLDILDPGQALVRHRIYRDSCVVVDGNYLKDLSVLGRELAHTIIVDNSPQAFGFQVDNGIPIESWYDDDADVELLKLLPFLEGLAGEAVPDVRPAIRQQFRLRELIDRA
ncbi:hypothetical protein HYH03_015400 [Edaphochlamys debaryana]|uniref:FCP1 homology domain-containing protein n=1 Tax=Edaphochlamys debaryana TaxID=47281 RepID=A0A835XJL9_9CHLO|nr:hypothetical protein HYH03_015400 [Edaphochlamys debaryana]|eukprot:KAG2485957.1 hypothetical protein HYH03_015400 [Edaphochlamys debaryana]